MKIKRKSPKQPPRLSKEKPCSLVLASTSPRRIELLSQVFDQFQVLSPDVDETPSHQESPARLVKRLSYEKATSAVSKLKNKTEAVVLAADTIVVSPSGRTILGKPETEAEARKMLGLLQGKVHQVLTGYCILKVQNGKTRKIVRVVRSNVKMKRMSSKLIEEYVKSGEPMDKAGSYGAQGLGSCFIHEIRGSYTNVVGLPMAHLLEDLEKSFGVYVESFFKPGVSNSKVKGNQI